MTVTFPVTILSTSPLGKLRLASQVLSFAWHPFLLLLTCTYRHTGNVMEPEGQLNTSMLSQSFCPGASDVPSLSYVDSDQPPRVQTAYHMHCYRSVGRTCLQSSEKRQ